MRSILNLPLGNTDSKVAGIMVNLVGEEGFSGDVIYQNIEKILEMKGINGDGYYDAAVFHDIGIHEAEKKYGMRIYQGGAVPGKKIRIVDIEGEDVEACGGTHLNRTAEVGRIRIIKSSKIQDGIVRLTFTAGKASCKRADFDLKDNTQRAWV